MVDFDDVLSRHCARFQILAHAYVHVLSIGGLDVSAYGTLAANVYNCRPNTARQTKNSCQKQHGGRDIHRTYLRHVAIFTQAQRRKGPKKPEGTDQVGVAFWYDAPSLRLCVIGFFFWR